MRIPQDQAMIHVCFTAKSNGTIKASSSRIRELQSKHKQKILSRNRELTVQLSNEVRSPTY